MKSGGPAMETIRLPCILEEQFVWDDKVVLVLNFSLNYDIITKSE